MTSQQSAKAEQKYQQARAAVNEYLTQNPGYSGTVELVKLERQMKQARRALDASR